MYFLFYIKQLLNSSVLFHSPHHLFSVGLDMLYYVILRSHSKQNGSEISLREDIPCIWTRPKRLRPFTQIPLKPLAALF